MGLAKVYPCTEFKVSSFIRYKFTEGDLKFKNSTNFGVSRTFRSRLIGQHLSYESRDLATLTFDLGGHYALVAETVRAPSVYQV